MSMRTTSVLLPTSAWLFEDGRLKLQPLCYDIASGAMVKPYVFLSADAYDPNWIFYFNNNPLVTSPGHPIIERALSQATSLLELTAEKELPEIQTTTGPGNLSKSIFDLGTTSRGGVGKRYSCIARLGFTCGFAMAIESPRRCQKLALIQSKEIRS